MTAFAITVSIIALIFLVALISSKHRHTRFAKKMKSRELELTRLCQGETEQARNERNLLLDALGDAFILVNSESMIRFANSAAHQLFGNRELNGRHIREAFPDPRLIDSILPCIQTGEPVRSDLILPQQSSPLGDSENRGINAWRVDAARLPNALRGGSTTRVIIRDLTAEHQTEQIRKDFVANASHELRTPLAIINGYLENLLEDDMLNERDIARHYLGIMRKHADRISRIVEDMLVISRLESGEASTLKVEPFYLGSCVNDVLERLESVIRNQGADVQNLLPEKGLHIHGDRFYWTQVFFNLIENALKQNPRAGLRVEVGCDETADAYRVWVSDNGIGIPSDDLPHIFRRFYRVEKHHSQREIKGTGLGLSIVKRAIEAHGATIQVTSTPGQDTRFLINIPRKS
jgi:two-component system phosphate regulon sensor histidine kinase PhoR